MFEECYSLVQIGDQSTTINQLAPQAQFRPRAFEKCSALQQLNFERTEYDPTNRNRSIPEGWEEEEQWTEDAWYDEAEETANVAVLMPLLMSDPLLISSAAMAEGHWWLLDLGASVSVLCKLPVPVSHTSAGGGRSKRKVCSREWFGGCDVIAGRSAVYKQLCEEQLL